MNPSTVRLATRFSSDAGLPLRMAQRAFAAVLEQRMREDVGEGGEFVVAQLRSAARRTLSGLSADEQSGLLRWLGLQIAGRNANEIAASSSRLFRVDAVLATGVMATLARMREELMAVEHAGAVAA